MKSKQQRAMKQKCCGTYKWRKLFSRVMTISQIDNFCDLCIIHDREQLIKWLFYKATNGIKPFALPRNRNEDFDFERRRNGTSELSALAGSEGCVVCADEVKLIRAQGECLGIRSR